jgi:predicted metallo-beta-lactamase superfamily hydrolase
MYDEPLKLVMAKKSDVVLVGGPPTYLEGFKVDSSVLVAAQRNLVALAQHVPRLVVDHHLLRSLDYRQYLKPAVQAAELVGNVLTTAAELIGKEPLLLEASRKQLHQAEPVEREWYERLQRGEFKRGFDA